MPIWVFGFVLFGTVFVDIDSWNSKVGKKFWFLSWIFVHRSMLHSLVAGLFLSLMVGIFSLWGCFGFFVGYVSHLFLDCLTVQGVRLFWPLGFRVKGFIKSGSWVEDIIFVLLLFSVVYFFVILIF
jgi:inner membrane protein